MKKTYISPVSKVADIESEQLICDSQRMFGTSATQGLDLVNDRFDFDEDDEDDEAIW